MKKRITAIIVCKNPRTDGFYCDTFFSNGDVDYGEKVYGDNLHYNALDDVNIVVNELRKGRGDDKYIIAIAQ